MPPMVNVQALALAQPAVTGGISFWGQTIKRNHGYEGATYSRNPHDVVIFEAPAIGTVMLPGLCTVEALPEHVYDRHKVEGRDGATLVMRGYLPGPVDISVLIWTPAQWEAMQVAIAKIWRKPGKLAPTQEAKASSTLGAAEAAVVEERALTIRHPSLQLLGVRTVVIRGISPPVRGPVPQSRVISIKALEYVPSPDKKKKPVRVGSTSGALQQPAGAFQPQGNILPGPFQASPGQANSGPNGVPHAIARGGAS